MRDSLVRFASKLGGVWCHLMHRTVTWPVHGRYQCTRCLRVYPVAWEHPVTVSQAEGAETGKVALRELLPRAARGT
jgi:hypothetical protein